MQLLTITGFDCLHTQSGSTVTGIGRMAVVLQFEKRVVSERQNLPADHSATILIFNGVRFERLESESETDQSPERSVPARRAN
jgi:hypothetical protein